MRSLKHWSRPEKAALGMWMLAGLLLLTIVAQQEPTRETTAEPSPRMASNQSNPIPQHSLPAATSLDRTLSAPIGGRRVKPVALALSDDSGKTRGDCVIHRDPHDTWFEFDNKYYGNAESCYDAQMEYSEEGKCFVDGKHFHENDMGRERTFVCRKGKWILDKPTFHPNPKDYWM